MIKTTGNIYCRNYLVIFFTFFLPFLYHSEIRAETYWIIEDPSALIIYNQYEQRLDNSEKIAFRKFSAWKIISQKHFLSDQFTSTLKTSFRNKIYYFQRAQTGELINKANAGHIEVLRNAQVIGDTIRIKRTDHVFLVDTDERTGLSEGTLLKRRFKYQNRYYVEDLVTRKPGWIKLPNPNLWEKYQKEYQDPAPDDQILVQIDHIFHTYNSRLSKLFDYLNTKYKTRHPLPRWSSEKTVSSIRYKIEPNSYRNRFNDTQFYIMQELRDLLHGSSLQVATERNQIIISTKSN